MHVPAALTGFQQHDLVVLAEVHEAVDAFGELHHVLDGLGDLYGTELPHGLPRLHRGRYYNRAQRKTRLIENPGKSRSKRTLLW